MKSLIEYYKQELEVLDKGARVFSDKYPALTDHLTRTGSDPDVSQIMQGLAFLTANIKQEMDLQSPDLLQALAEVIAPTCIQPIPSATVMHLAPKKSLKKTLRLSSDTHFDSKALGQDLDGHEQRCRFRLAWDSDIFPAQVENIREGWRELEVNNELKRVKHLDLSMTSEVPIENIEKPNLRFYINLPYPEALVWYELFTANLSAISLKYRDGSHIIPTHSLSSKGFAKDSAIFALKHCNNLHSLLLDYFLFPQKMFFFEFDKTLWPANLNGNEFTIRFEFKNVNFAVPTLTTKNLSINCAPAVNTFSANIEPVRLELTDTKIPVQARMKALQGDKPLPIISVKRVETVLRGRDRNRLFNALTDAGQLLSDSACYAHIRSTEAKSNQLTDYISIFSEELEKSPGNEILRAVVECTNGKLAESVNPGDICEAAPNSPESVTYKNITGCSKYCAPSIVTEQAWQVVADQALSLSAINTAEELRNLLLHHIPAKLKNDGLQRANSHRVAAIEKIKLKPADSIVRGVPIRGIKYDITIRGEHFVSTHDEYAFGCLLNSIMGMRTTINSFSQLTIINATTGEQREWPINLPTLM